MAYFIKITTHHLHTLPSNKAKWLLVLETREDVINYTKFESGLFRGELKSILVQKQEYAYVPHYGTNVGGAISALESIQEVTGEECEDIMDKWQSSKVEHMLKLIEQGEEIIVNENKGYSDKRISFELWKAKELSRIEIKNNDWGFPINDSDEPINKKDLILENDSNVAESFLIKIGLLGKEYGVINNLKERSREFILKSLENAENIFIDTLALDVDQNSGMIEIFGELIFKKNITISTNTNGYRKLMSNEKFGLHAGKHNLTILK